MMRYTYFAFLSTHFLAFYQSSCFFSSALVANRLGIAPNLVLDFNGRVLHWRIFYMFFAQSFQIFTQMMLLKLRLLLATQKGDQQVMQTLFSNFHNFFIQYNPSFSLLSNTKQYINPRVFAKDRGLRPSLNNRYAMSLIISSSFADKAPLRFFKKISGVVVSVLPKSDGAWPILADYWLPLYTDLKFSDDCENLLMSLVAQLLRCDRIEMQLQKFKFLFGLTWQKRLRYEELRQEERMMHDATRKKIRLHKERNFKKI